MFFTKIVALFAVVAAVAASPIPLPLALARRGEQAVREFGVTPDFAHEAIVKRQTVAVEAPAMSLDGTIEPFVNPGAKRSVEAEVPVVKRAAPSVQDAAMSTGDGVIVPYVNPNGKRSEVPPMVKPRGPAINTFPTSIAARSDGGEIVAF